jgi:hypothetical protein
MKPGRELDLLIAEKVMGYKVRFVETDHWSAWQISRNDGAWEDYESYQKFRYSKRIGSAMKVWAKMRELGCCIILNEDVEVPAWSVTVKGPRWRPGLQTDEHKVLAFVETDVSMAYSICMAALKLFDQKS